MPPAPNPVARQGVVRWAPIVAVAGGGIVGSASRTLVGQWLGAGEGRFPTSILVVNIAGSLVLGFYLARREQAVTRRWSLHFWAIGLLGSFTTFSAFSLDVVRLLGERRAASAIAYVSASIVGGLMAASIGRRVGDVIG